MTAPNLITDLTVHTFKAIFEDAVTSYYAPLYRFAYSLAKNEHEASDLTQQAYYVYAQKGSTIKETTKVKHWLFTTLYREFLKQRRMSHRLAGEDEMPLDDDSITVDASTFEYLDPSKTMIALQSVEELYRIPLALYYVDDNSYQEIAEILSIPIGTVMSRISRGRNLLKKILIHQDHSTDSLLP